MEIGESSGNHAIKSNFHEDKKVRYTRTIVVAAVSRPDLSYEAESGRTSKYVLTVHLWQTEVVSYSITLVYLKLLSIHANTGNLFR